MEEEEKPETDNPSKEDGDGQVPEQQPGVAELPVKLEDLTDGDSYASGLPVKLENMSELDNPAAALLVKLEDLTDAGNLFSGLPVKLEDLEDEKPSFG
jgi:hypothetical protein